ncbi:MAG TPA: sigma-70 family RNA polymerase sigma factor [Dehalococcoidia bacterium]|nr:sigma-70 family RNA polymerase sigma factor [Dehalococcoidia bacterium]
MHAPRRRPTLEESELVERARGGEAAAYEMLVRRYQALAFRVAFVLLGDAAEAEDAAQEAFLKAWQALPRFRAGAPLRPWLLRIVANEARNRRSAASRRGRLALRAAELPAAGEDPPSSEDAALAAERRAALLEALNGLRPEERLVIAHRYLFELSEAEMAEALGCPRGTVKSRLSRALARLRARLGGAGEEAVDD